MEETKILKEFSRIIKVTGQGNWAESKDKLKNLLDDMHLIVAGKGNGTERERSKALHDTIKIMYNICCRKVKEAKSHL